MKVMLVPCDQNAVGKNRIIWPAEILKSRGYDINITDGTFSCEMVKDQDGSNVIVGLAEDIPHDVVVFQRVAEENQLELIKLLQEKGKAIVVEVDDNYSALHKDHPLRNLINPVLSPKNNWKILEKACEIADLVTCTTQSLADFYAPHGRYKILKNYVPERYLRIKHNPQKLKDVGWTGSTMTHIKDLEVVGDSAMRLQRAGAQFCVVGTGVGVKDQLKISYVKVLGQHKLEKYAFYYAKMGIAICPLQPSNFNDCKSWLKVIEAASLGIPTVASPSEDYLEAEKLGLCEIAKTPDEWFSKVLSLVDDQQKRVNKSQEIRDIMQDMTYEKHAEQWWQAWEQALENGKSR
jgi:glycosyltransferase involved in cell wall biosynthesis